MIQYLSSVLSSVDQDEEMDTSPLAQPFFVIDEDRGDVENREGEDRDSGQDEDPGSPLEDEEEEDADVSTTRRVSARIRSKRGGKTNGQHPSVSEESSEEEDEEEEEEVAGKAAKRLSAASTRSQTIAS